MSHSVEITDNTFFSIFSDAVLLYELASIEGNKNTQNTLAKSSILSVNYALEAAANSFLMSVETSSKIKDKLDKFSTLDKFDFVLQWSRGETLPRGEAEAQIVKKLIDQRNALVHPKVKTINKEVTTAKGNDKVSFFHKAITSDSSEKCRITKMSVHPAQYSAEDALIALQALVSFLNRYVENWLKMKVENSALLLMRSWDGSVQASPIMYQKHELEIVLRHNENLNIRFVGLYGILEQFE